MTLRCGRQGIRIGHWEVCELHDNPDFVAHVKKLMMAEWLYRFEPDRRGQRERPPDYW